MSIRGERFVVDFSDDEPEDGSGSLLRRNAESVDPSSFSFVGDIVEREPTVAKPPAAPSLRSTASGFPEHRKRHRVSSFKQQRARTVGSDSARDSFLPASRASQSATQTNANLLTQQDGSFEEIEMRKIHEENSQRIASMSEEEIQRERNELLASLSPTIIENLLKRASLDDGRGDTGIDPVSREATAVITPTASLNTSAQKPTAKAIPEPTAKRVSASRTVTFEDDEEPVDPGKLRPVSNPTREVAALTDLPFHFPHAPSVPDLDPSDPSFLESLHNKYFPSLPADPSKLAWMAPIPTHGSIADQESPYYPGQNSLPPSALRFDFRGALLPPRIARAMPTTKGLHHHGEAPEAAGYTIPELARLARSSFPAQRCVAFQALGRFLYRLGRGEWGDEGSEISKGLWRCVDEGKVIETLEEAANAEGGHQGSKVYAVEAVWLWHKGGGKRWKAG